MSVFDDSYYCRKNGSAEEFESDDKAQMKFLNKCDEMKSNQYGFFRADDKNVGFVCSTGICDGMYLLYLAIDKNGEIIGIKISFL